MLTETHWWWTHFLAMRKYDKNIDSNVWGGENLAEASMFFSGSEVGCEDTQWQQHKPQGECHSGTDSPSCAGPSLLTASQGAPAHPSTALTWVTAAASAWGRGHEMRNTAIPWKGVHFLQQCPWSLLHCRSGLCRAHRDVLALQAPQARSSCSGLCSVASSTACLDFFWWSRAHICPEQQLGHPVWFNCCFMVPVIQASPSQVSLLAWDHCQALKHCLSLVKYCHPQQPWGEAGLTEHTARSVHTAGL